VSGHGSRPPAQGFCWRRIARLVSGVLLLGALLGGCAGMVPQTMALRTAWPAGVPQQTEIAELPFFPQLEHQCGPAALATALVHAGVSTTPEQLTALVYLPQRKGSLQVEMLVAPRHHSRVSYRLGARFDDLLREVAAGNPVIVLQDKGIGALTIWHYAVVAGFDYPKGELYLRSGETRRQAIPFTIFEHTWRKSGYWAMVALPPQRLPVSASEPAYVTAVAAMERVGDAQAAATAYASALARWPGNELASIGLANHHYARREFEQAQAVLQSAAQHHPGSVLVLNNLAQTLSETGRNDEALKVIDRALEPPSHRFAAQVRETRALILSRMASGR
jgi:hypothetical protein